MSIQVKWLNYGRFRRFELGQLNFCTLILELQKRVPSFNGSICYIDDQNDKIVIENDQDLLDMIGYFRQVGENVMRIQTDEQQPTNSSKCADLAVVENGQEKALVVQRKERGTMGESESAEEASPKEEHSMPKRSKNANCPNAAVDKVELVDFVGEEEEVLDWPNFGRQSSESMQSPSFASGGGDFSHFDEANMEEMNSNDSATQRPNQRKRRPARSAAIPCTDCGMFVANASTSLKSHVNLHHLKLPIYNCRLCGQMSTQLQKASIVRHIERDHPGSSCEEFDYNYPTFSRKIHHKLAECFPKRNAEMSQSIPKIC